MKKNEFVRVVTEVVKANGEFAVTQKETDVYIDAIKRAIVAAMGDGEEVSIPGLVKFSVVDQAARTARNPKTGELIEVPEKKKVKVKILGDLKSSVE